MGTSFMRSVAFRGRRYTTPAVVDHRRVAVLRAQGLGWKRIAAELKVGVGTIYRLAVEGSKIRRTVISNPSHH
jgi:hypothetical protein